MQTFAAERQTIEELPFISPENGWERLDDDFETEKDLNFKTESETKESSDLHVAEPITDRLSQDRGGQPHEWQRDTSYEGDEKWRFNGTEIVDASGESLTKKIEAMGNQKYIEQHQDFLRHLTENPDKEYLQQDWIQETPEGKKVIVTVARMDANGIIRNENWFIVDDSERKQEEEGLIPVESGFDPDLDTTVINYEYENEEMSPELVTARTEQQALAEAIAELLAEDEEEFEEVEANGVAAIAKETLVMRPEVSIAERMERVAKIFLEPESQIQLQAEPQQQSGPKIELQAAPISKQESVELQTNEESLKIPQTIEVVVDISPKTRLSEVSSKVDVKVTPEVSQKEEAEAEVAKFVKEGVSESETKSPEVVSREVSIEAALVPATEKDAVVTAPEVKSATEVVTAQAASIQTAKPRAAQVDTAPVLSEEPLESTKNPDITPSTPFSEASVIDLSNAQDSNKARIENSGISNSELTTEVIPEVVVDKTITESIIDTPFTSTTRELIHTETTNEITSEDSKVESADSGVRKIESEATESSAVEVQNPEPVSETIKTSEVKEDVALPTKENLVSKKEAEPVGIKLGRIEKLDQVYGIQETQEKAKIAELVRVVETSEVVEEKVAVPESSVMEFPESLSRRQYFSQMFLNEDMNAKSANDNRVPVESRVRVTARNGIIMRLAA